MTTLAWASPPALQPGDVLLESLPCFMCSLMEIEEGLPYSHSGVVVAEPNGSLSVVEAYVHIDRIPLNEFISRRRKGTETLALRPELASGVPSTPASINSWLNDRFREQFASHSYDPDFLWNNSDANGEKHYCSELVTKLINPLLAHPVLTKPMHFDHYREYWIKYFKHTPPDRTPGVSPADLARSKSFALLGKF